MDIQDLSLVRAALIRAGQEDQRVRQEKDLASWDEVDRENLILLKQVIATHGWPTRSLVGDVAENSAWAIAQHAVSDLPFMRQVWKMRADLPPYEIAPQTNLLLEDRLLVHSEQAQKFGTQIKGNLKVGFKPFPIEGINIDKLLAGDPNEMQAINTRRAAVGLGQYEEYLAFFKIQPGVALQPSGHSY